MDVKKEIEKNINGALKKGNEEAFKMWLNAMIELERAEKEQEKEKFEKELELKRLELFNQKEIETNKINVEQRKIDREEKNEKKELMFRVFELVVRGIEAVGRFGEGFVKPFLDNKTERLRADTDLRTARIAAEQKKLCTKMITDIEKDGDIPYQQATKHHTW